MGEILTGELGFRRGAHWRGNAGDVAGVPGGDEDRDGALGSEAKVMASTAQLPASLVDVEVRPETWARRVMARSLICCELNQMKNVRWGAGERGRR
jgi:hypothetical protein